MDVLATATAWTDILESIRKRVSSQQFATWFRNLKTQSFTPEELNIRVPNNFFKEWLAQNYLKTIDEAVAEVAGCRPKITFTLDPNVQATVSEDGIEAAPRPTAPRPIGLRLNEHYTFEKFVVGPSNQLAHAAALAVCESPGRTYNPLFVYGSVGLGKSHLLQAICHASLPKYPAQRIAYLSCETFVNEFISAIQRNELPAFRARYRQLEFLFIDDIQFLSRAERSQEEFFHTFNDLYNAEKQIVVSSDQPPQEISGLQERLMSRFKSGLVARMDPPSYEMRVAILNRKAELREVTVPEEVIDYIATVITTNIRELDGAITKVVGYASLLKQQITLDMARAALQEPPRPGPAVTVEDILRVVTTRYNVRVSDLQSRKRTRSIVLPRQICMYLARALTPLSLEEIGGYFGGRDHSTVLHAEAKIASSLEQDTALSHALEALKHDLRAPAAGRRSATGAVTDR
ncbi:MAG: chromosomal replication initiator protein DnaA [Candidatus Brocadiia bacterium]|jgi:chromosomal replication initiator protein